MVAMGLGVSPNATRHDTNDTLSFCVVETLTCGVSSTSTNTI